MEFTSSSRVSGVWSATTGFSDTFLYGRRWLWLVSFVFLWLAFCIYPFNSKELKRLARPAIATITETRSTEKLQTPRMFHWLCWIAPLSNANHPNEIIKHNWFLKNTELRISTIINCINMKEKRSWNNFSFSSHPIRNGSPYEIFVAMRVCVYVWLDATDPNAVDALRL